MIIGVTTGDTRHSDGLGGCNILPAGLFVKLKLANNPPDDSRIKYWAHPLPGYPWPLDTIRLAKECGGIGLYAEDVEIQTTDVVDESLRTRCDKCSAVTGLYEWEPGQWRCSECIWNDLVQSKRLVEELLEEIRNFARAAGLRQRFTNTEVDDELPDYGGMSPEASYYKDQEDMRCKREQDEKDAVQPI